MGVGMVQLDQRLVTRLESHRGEGRFDFEHGESLLARGKRASGRIAPAIALAAATRTRRTLGEYTEMIANSARITGSVPIPQPPARALPDGVVADLGFDFGVAHPGIVIPGRIVSANMLQAEPVIVAQIEPRFGRSELAASDTAGMIASAHRGLGRRLEQGI